MAKKQTTEKLALKNPDWGCLMRDRKGKIIEFDSVEECCDYGIRHPKSPFTWIVGLE